MQLMGNNILSVEMMDQYFNMEELWKNIDNGTLYTFEQRADSSNTKLQSEILKTLEAIEKKETPDFLLKGLSLEELEQKLKPFTDGTKSIYDNMDFFERNWNKVEKISASLLDECTSDLAWRLYLMLLLFCQARPKKAVSDEDRTFLQKCFEQQTLSRTVDRKLFLFEGYLLYAKDCTIYAWYKGKWHDFFTSERPVKSFGYSKDFGLIMCMDDGSVPPQTYRMRALKELIGNEKIKEVSVYSGQVGLLTQDGRFLTNMELKEPQKKVLESTGEIMRINMGFNSISGITRNGFHAFQVGLNEDFSVFSNVEITDTRKDENERYAILEQQGELFLDHGRRISGVSAACLTADGYAWITPEKDGDRLWICKAGNSQKQVDIFPQGISIKELCFRSGRLACRGRKKTEDLIYLYELYENRADTSKTVPLPKIEESDSAK